MRQQDHDLIQSIERNNIVGVEKSVRNGANINAELTLDGDGFNKQLILNQAVKRGNPDIVRFLLKQPVIEVNKKGEWGMTPLMTSITYKRTDMAQLLLQHPKIDINVVNDEQISALELSVIEWADDIFDLLLANSKIDVRSTKAVLQEAFSESKDPHLGVILARLDAVEKMRHSGFLQTTHSVMRSFLMKNYVRNLRHIFTRGIVLLAVSSVALKLILESNYMSFRKN